MVAQFPGDKGFIDRNNQKRSRGRLDFYGLCSPFELSVQDSPPAAPWLAIAAICSFIFLFISWGVGSAIWVPTIHVYPSGSTTVPTRSPQNMSITGPFAVAPSLTALATTLSAFSTQM